MIFGAFKNKNPENEFLDVDEMLDEKKKKKRLLMKRLLETCKMIS